MTPTPTQDMVLPYDPGRLLPRGTISLANEERFTAGNFSEELTAYATGWADPTGLKEILDYVAPEVPGPRRFEWAKGAASKSYFVEADDVRAIGAPFKKVDYVSAMEQGRTENKGLRVAVEKDQLASNPLWRRVYVAYLLARLYRNDLVRAVTGILAAAANTAKTWDSTSGKDPDMDVLDLIIAAEAAGGACNRVLYGQEAWRQRWVSLRSQDVAGVSGSAVASPEQLALAFGVSQVAVSNHYYRSAPDTLSRIVPSNVLAFYGETEPTPTDASSAKRFVSWCDGGSLVRVYEEGKPSQGVVDISVEHYSKVIVTGSASLAKLTISAS